MKKTGIAPIVKCPTKTVGGKLPEFMMLSGMESRDFEAAEREELQALISTLPIEKVRQLLEELR